MSFPRYPAYKESGVEWLGAVPVHWDVAPYKRMVSLQNGSDHKHIECDDGYPVIGSGGQFACASEFMHDGESVLLGRKGTIDKPLYVSGKFWTVDTMYWSKIQPGAFGRFAYYSALTIPFGYYSTNTALPSMTKSVLEAHLLASPPEQEQVAIAAFLDRETAKIDALVAEQEQLITLLKEKRQAVISHAVTKGLDPSVPMKDSGVEWLGEVPEHWQVNRLQRVVKPGTSVTYGIVQAGPDFEGGIPYIRTSDMAGDELPVDGYPKTSPEIDASYARSKVSAGDLVIAIRATVGKCLPVPQELDGANLTQGTARIAPGPDTDPGYLLSFINGNASQTYFDRMAKGATFREITLEVLRKTPVLVPPLDEQSQIASWVKQQSEQFSSLIREAEEAQVLLKERRSALISAAVTGQIDVRGLALAKEAA
ncbi:restriction endonuclease subunit S [Aquabacterium sp. A3]|uniref:restriction endonuclease subunit S n=1 Tax=Aquabacterium sp. A3 TaxID=3132829 RepID=UPI003119E3DB